MFHERIVSPSGGEVVTSSGDAGGANCIDEGGDSLPPVVAGRGPGDGGGVDGGALLLLHGHLPRHAVVVHHRVRRRGRRRHFLIDELDVVEGDDEVAGGGGGRGGEEGDGEDKLGMRNKFSLVQLLFLVTN